MEINFDQMVASLRKIQRDHGEESFQSALRGLFRNLIVTDSGMQYAKRLLGELGCPGAVDLEALKSETAQPKTPSEGQTPAQVLEAGIHQAVPNCKTQAHFDLILQAWQALTVYVNAAYGFDVEAAKKARDGLNRLLDLAPQLAQVHAKIQENPEATTNRDYVEPPKQSTEAVTHAALVDELSKLDSMLALQTWYASARPRMDRIVTQKLRDELFDAIRRRKHTLSN